MSQLQEFITRTATEYGVPGASVGVFFEGREVFASHGVTSLAHPRPVTEHTLFTIGSVTKTFTATVLAQLAAEGKVDLDAPVRAHIPELVLPDEEHAAAITVGQLLDHTAGFGWGDVIETDEGDGALAMVVERMATIELIGKPGERASYSQAAYNLAGRVIEKITGEPYEKVVARMLLAPLGLAETTYFATEAMLREFAVGHDAEEDGSRRAVRMWKPWRGGNPGGGLAISMADLLRWARFQLGDVEGPVSREVLEAMKVARVEMKSSSLADAIGLSWFLRDVGGSDGGSVRTVGHGGSGTGQFGELLLVPERGFAVVVASNDAAAGYQLNQAVAKWTLEHYLGVVDADPEPVAHDAARTAVFAGRYDIDAMTVTVTSQESGMTIAAAIKAEVRATSTDEMPPDIDAAPMGMLDAESDEFIVVDGGLKGQRGVFHRDASGAITGLDLAGRLFARV
ncbi:penicillin-binding protein [Actinorhabdospora filicis]|uniref:Penicillin-binding protein n=1 Tax=Actinorhabdospora filicis TaxID=1785913 RepID=A0A9W6W7I9_9ACTN|nr:serine hydrolase domain-containing protein [Actinorhabdospora filicis]GLZ76609.1 penicillin-binding protein [Actinorhabdospora filicis]